MNESVTSDSRGWSFFRTALVLAGSILTLSLALSPIAWQQSGSGGLAGLALAAAICLVVGILCEAASCYVVPASSPLAGLLVGMVIRMVPLLVLCLVMAARGVHGREHLAFVGYLLTFYMVVLVLETRAAIARVSSSPSDAHAGSY